MFEEIGQYADERESLAEFLSQLKQLLLHIAFERYFERFAYPADDGLVLAPLPGAHYQRALSEYLGSGEYERLLDLVRALAAAQMTRHGLAGAQLGIKRETIRLTEQRFVAHPSGRLFRRLLQALDVLLDSILAATGGGSALKELKDTAGLLPAAA